MLSMLEVEFEVSHGLVESSASRSLPKSEASSLDCFLHSHLLNALPPLYRHLLGQALVAQDGLKI